MKKLIFIAILVSIFAIGDVSAQVISYSQTKITEFEKEKKPVKFQQFAGAELVAIPKKYSPDALVGVFYEAGVLLNKSIFVGGGVGLGYVSNNLVKNLLLSEDNTDFEGVYGFTGKVYVNAKFYLTKTKLRPYFDLSVGGVYKRGYINKSYSSMGYAETTIIDLGVNPQFGLNYYIGGNVNSVFMNVGYYNNALACDYGYGIKGIMFKLGITF